MIVALSEAPRLNTLTERGAAEKLKLWRQKCDILGIVMVRLRSP